MNLMTSCTSANILPLCRMWSNHWDGAFNVKLLIADDRFVNGKIEQSSRDTDLPIGVNVLANATVHALAVASASSARFVRVNQWANAYVANEGLIEGVAGRAMRYRRELGAHGVRIFANAHVKHGAHAIVQDRSIADLVRDVEFFNADVVIATGQRTGHAADLAYIREIKSATSLPVLVGSGVTADNVSEMLGIVEGAIVASALKIGGRWWNPVEPERARQFVLRARA
jgi:membrane complex biogenesis BtpA family protein